MKTKEVRDKKQDVRDKILVQGLLWGLEDFRTGGFEDERSKSQEARDKILR
ncbi:hypothetical protein VB776_18395 [Arcicella sp. DC2W]|uniref:Uncharacterized protein n=1 Tax=Arcicella gelida TaxID=2984195 RepID=A0ABU5S8W7_9BACT|nr:hypothetical protein [Arcicella sp. DC2W]MEA5404911.1 hypothetical protein [Arcicella sp. DC2W]